MDEAFLAQLRCPLDPERQANLVREEQQIRCTGCHVHFPVKQGLPVLVPDEAELPVGMRELSQLPCQRRANRRKSLN
ncbi:hypothetical protein R5W23_005227 [Gemmata sp. JC673]|uniref:Trm112 family protein n=1 Tax=Gemmata algarum TaxID=2975278 RepID=A0ABU5F7N4_9BACT|nr:hypothetical protein [Gemmata algarum]MDY3563613.1 hypothetical protein [Gemmata algarum]